MQLAHIQSRPLYQIFLDLSKVYDTLDQSQTLQLLKQYGMGPRLLQLLTHFWDSLQVIARQQNYYGSPFRSERGTTQGDMISPTIFNIVVDAIVRAWYHQLDQEGLSDVVGAIFYADDGHLYSHDADALEQATSIIVDLFKRMGLKTNTTKTKALICAPKPSVTRICSPAYKRRMGINADELTHRERKRQKVECEICDREVQARSLTRHKRLRHGIEMSLITQQPTPPNLATASSETYTVSIPHYNNVTECPVPSCKAIVRSRFNMRQHFIHRHFHDKIIIMEEGSLERCHLCGMFCTPLLLAGRHQESTVCKKGAKQNQQKQLDLQCIRAFRRTFQIQDQLIKTVQNFRYLGRIITSNDNDWIAAHSNLRKARQWWAEISRVLTRESTNPRISAFFYKATVQAILLYGSETWVITDKILQLLTSFHHGIARRLTGHFPRPSQDDTDEWTYPSIQETLQIAGLFPMEEYLR